MGIGAGTATAIAAGISAAATTAVAVNSAVSGPGGGAGAPPTPPPFPAAPLAAPTFNSQNVLNATDNQLAAAQSQSGRLSTVLSSTQPGGTTDKLGG